MAAHARESGVGIWSLVWLGFSCAPASDLDLHARGVPASAPEATGSMPGAAGSGALMTEDPLAPAGTDGRDGDGIGEPLPLDGAVALADAGAVGTPMGGEPVDGGAGGAGPALPPPPNGPVVAPDLPDDLAGAPVAGEIVFSDEAEWEVDAVFEPTFEIHTPTASYWVVKPLGTIVSIEDREATPAQWVAFSSGFRPLRGVPSFPTPPATRVSTVRDDASQTPTHVRLTSSSDDGLWSWVWDFYVTHVTFTVNRAPVPLGFAYQGVPGGSLGAEDRLVLSDGIAQGARNSFNADLAGPVEWAYLADTALGRSIFALQHRDDALAERYQVRDNDTSLLLLGNGQIEELPIRFSLGIVPSVDHDVVTRRVEFVAGAIR